MSVRTYYRADDVIGVRGNITALHNTMSWQHRTPEL